jgi:hypothetical protein
MTTASDTLRELRDQMNALVPYPQSAPFPAQELIRHYAAEVVLHTSRFHLSMKDGGAPDVSIVPLISASFAAMHALLALHKADPAVAAGAAMEIWAICGNGDTDEFAADYLGDGYAAVLELAGQIAACPVTTPCPGPDPSELVTDDAVTAAAGALHVPHCHDPACTVRTVALENARNALEAGALSIAVAWQQWRAARS